MSNTFSEYQATLDIPATNTPARPSRNRARTIKGALYGTFIPSYWRLAHF